MKGVVLILHLSLLLNGSIANFTSPNFKLLMNLLTDSPGFFTQDTEKFLEAYAEGGLSKQQVESRGKEATTFFKERFGVNFTDIDDAYYTNGTFVGYDGSVSFQFFLVEWSDEDPFRMVSAIDDKKSAIFKNALIHDVGWVLGFNDDFESTGSLNMIIPAGSQAIFGDFFLLVEKDNNREKFFPKKALYNNNSLRLKSKCAEPIFPPATLPMGRQVFVPLNCDVSNGYYGDGAIRILTRAGTWARGVVSFPE